jgi:ABC-2 type transport system ATP-binding protein
MSSHVLPEVERVCDRIGLLRAGKLVLLATVQETRALASRRVRVFFETPVEPPSALPPGHTAFEITPLKWELRVEGDLGPLLRLIQSHPVKDLRVDEPALEDVLGKYYREDVA